MIAAKGVGLLPHRLGKTVGSNSAEAGVVG